MEASIDNYRRAIEKHLLRTFAKVTLSELAPEHLEELMRTLGDGGSVKSSAMRARGVLRRALDDAVARRHLSWNPVTPTHT